MPGLMIFEPRRVTGDFLASPGSHRRALRRTFLCLASITLAGCKTAPYGPDTKPGSPPAAQAQSVPDKNSAAAKALDDLSLNRTDFHRSVSKEQQYNVHLELGRFQESQENFELALAEYQKALEACERHPLGFGGGKGGAKQALAHRRAGSALDRMGRFEQAENHYKTALKLSPNDPKVWNDAGYSYYLQQRWADSERALKTADSLDPNNTRILTNLGLTLAASGKTDDALAAFTKAGGQAAGHANLAYILAAMGKTDLARKHYQTALEYQPELVNAKLALGALDSQAARQSQAQLAAPAVPAINPPSSVAASPRVPPTTGQAVVTDAGRPVVTRTSLPDTPRINPTPSGATLAVQPATHTRTSALGAKAPNDRREAIPRNVTTAVPTAVPLDAGVTRTSAAGAGTVPSAAPRKPEGR